MPRDGVYFPQLGFAADWFVNQVIAFRHGLCFIPEPLAVWRDTGAGFAYAVIDSPDRQPLRDVFMETLKLLSLPEYEDVTELMIRGCSLHIFPTDIRTPIMAFKALRDLQAKNNQVDALFMHLVAEYVGELLDCNVHRLHSAENVLRRMTETATLSTEVYGGAGVVASEGKSDAPGMDDACNDPSKRKFSWDQDEISQRLADAARRLAALESLEEELRDLKGVAAALETEKDVLIDQGRKLHERLARYQNSASWTITKPLRFAARALTGRR